MPEPGNDFSGSAENVVQVGTLYGNVVFAGTTDLTDQAKAFEEQYRRGIFEGLDRVDLFEPDRRRWASTYRLSTAYVDLSLADPTVMSANSTGLRIEDVLAGHRRLLLEGSAGTGKTTVLRRLAIRALHGELPDQVAGTPHPVPFLLKLRSFVQDDVLVLPEPEEFVAAVAKPLSQAKPEVWVSRLLGSGRALVLVDGIDEVRDAHRRRVLDWVRELIEFYPDVGYLITSRPTAVQESWRNELRSLGFATVQLEPMSRAQVADFIDHWYQATQMAARYGYDWPELAETLKHAVATRRDLAKLTTSPLLCGILCAVHSDRHASLPSTRSALYDTAVSLLLERRDTMRSLRTIQWQLPRAVSHSLLRRIALWMVLNNQETIPLRIALNVIEDVAQHIIEQEYRRWGRPKETGLLYDLIEQTGILQETGDGQVEFRFPSFQDYFAAMEIIRQDHVAHLILNAHSPSYHDVVIMTAEQADPSFCERLLTDLTRRAEEDPAHQRELWLLAAACIANAVRVAPELVDRIRTETVRLLPPASLEDAYGLAGAGWYVVDLLIELAQTREFTDTEAAESIRAASLIDVDQALPLLQLFSERSNEQVQHELTTARSRTGG